MPHRIPQSVAIRVPLKGYLSSDHIADAVGLTIPVTISKNGAGFANPSAGATNAVSIGNGWYYVDLSTTDTGTLGPLVIRGISATMDNIEIVYQVVDPHTMGADYLDAAISTRTKPADTQARVALVDVTTTNSDMRGTDGAATASALATAHGSGSWLTATGFSTPTNVTDAVTALESYGDAHWAEQGGLTKEAIRVEMDSNSAKLAAIKTKTDTLGGAGAIAWPFQVTDTGGGPVDDAEVKVTTDSQGLIVSANGTTDASGYVTPTFRLDPGTYYFWATAKGENAGMVQETVA